MALILLYYTSFERSMKSLDPGQKEIVKRILKGLLIYYFSNCDVAKAKEEESGFFYKQLSKPYYEAGVEGKVRVLIERDKSECFVILAGNHDQIKRFLVKY